MRELQLWPVSLSMVHVLDQEYVRIPMLCASMEHVSATHLSTRNTPYAVSAASTLSSVIRPPPPLTDCTGWVKPRSHVG